MTADHAASSSQMPIQARRTASWVVREKLTGNVILETYNPKFVQALNTVKYEAVPILDYLSSLNRIRVPEDKITETRPV